jgi:hypothetical protein
MSQMKRREAFSLHASEEHWSVSGTNQLHALLLGVATQIFDVREAIGFTHILRVAAYDRARPDWRPDGLCEIDRGECA